MDLYYTYIIQNVLITISKNMNIYKVIYRLEELGNGE